MKKVIPILAVSLAVVAVGIAGFFVCDATKTQPIIRAINRANITREIRVQEFSRMLADSIAATEAWLVTARVKDSVLVSEAIARTKTTYAGREDRPFYQESIGSLEKMLSDIRSEQLPYMIHTRRHIDWMKQEIAWLNREAELLP